MSKFFNEVSETVPGQPTVFVRTRQVLRVLIAVLVLATSPAWSATYTTKSGWLSFSYPDGWVGELSDSTPTRYVENTVWQPKGQEFSAQPGQIVLRVFDPFYVLEEAGTYDYADRQAVFMAFIRNLPGESNPVFSVASIKGVNTFVARSKSEGIPTTYFGRVDNDYLVVVGAAGSTRNNEYPDDLLASVLTSARAGANLTASREPAKAVAAWYTALGQGDTRALSHLTCTRARRLEGLLGLATDGQSMLAQGAIVQAARSFDFSGLRFTTVEANQNHAVVRVAGLEQGPGRRVVSFPAAAQRFGSNVVAVEYEGEGWRVCEHIRGNKAAR